MFAHIRGLILYTAPSNLAPAAYLRDAHFETTATKPAAEKRKAPEIATAVTISMNMLMMLVLVIIVILILIVIVTVVVIILVVILIVMIMQQQQRWPSQDGLHRRRPIL